MTKVKSSQVQAVSFVVSMSLAKKRVWVLIDRRWWGGGVGRHHAREDGCSAPPVATPS